MPSSESDERPVDAGPPAKLVERRDIEITIRVGLRGIDKSKRGVKPEQRWLDRLFDRGFLLPASLDAAELALIYDRIRCMRETCPTCTDGGVCWRIGNPCRRCGSYLRRSITVEFVDSATNKEIAVTDDPKHEEQLAAFHSDPGWSRERRSIYDGRVVSETIYEGRITTRDRNGRECLESRQPTRVMLTEDLRRVGAGLHIGQLGWTVVDTSDGYKSIVVEFDSGQRLHVARSTFCRVVPEQAAAIAASEMSKYRNTRFDSDPAVAARLRSEWIASSYSDRIDMAGARFSGEGDQEVYAFTYQSQIDAAKYRCNDRYRVKVGHTGRPDPGSLDRILEISGPGTGLPERPLLLFVERSWSARRLEVLIHQRLRGLGGRAQQSLGKEWFETSREELLAVLDSCPRPNFDPDRVVRGATWTIEEGLRGILARGASVEFGVKGEMAGMSPAIFIRVHEPKDMNGG